jgi:hypothetical protein
MRPRILRPKRADFKSVSDFNSDWADRIALLIIVGLAVDIINVFVPDQTWHNRLAIIANALIALGVWGELHFAKRARTADDSRVAEAETTLANAIERASRAEEELIRLRTPRRHRFPIIPARRALETALSSFAGTPFVIGMGPNDGEVQDFIWDIGPVLWAAGWIQLDWIYPGGTVKGEARFGGPGFWRPAMAPVPAQNVLIMMDAGVSAIFSPAADALVSELGKLGIEAHVVPFNIHTARITAMHILIGPIR